MSKRVLDDTPLLLGLKARDRRRDLIGRQAVDIEAQLTASPAPGSSSGCARLDHADEAPREARQSDRRPGRRRRSRIGTLSVGRWQSTADTRRASPYRVSLDRVSLAPPAPCTCCCPPPPLAQNIFEDLSRKSVARAVRSAATMTQLKSTFVASITHTSDMDHPVV